MHRRSFLALAALATLPSGCDVGLARRLLMAAGGGGGFTDMGYSMTADETAFWQDLAALLDPDAYAFTIGQNQSITVATGERWYLANGWWVQATGGAGHFFHRTADVHDALPLTEGRVLTTRNTVSGGYMYVCKPSLVTGGDSRYTSDPRGLYFDRIQRIAELTQYTVGVTETGAANNSAAFPTDFTDGLVIGASAHDVAWLGLEYTDTTSVLNLQDEISDTDRIRFATKVILPFKRTTFPEVQVRGVSETEGCGNVTYLKLPADW